MYDSGTLKIFPSDARACALEFQGISRYADSDAILPEVMVLL